MKNNQKGFSGVEALIALVVLALVVGVGWFVWQQQDNKKPSVVNQNKTISTNKSIKSQDYTDCHTEPDKTIGEAAPSGIALYEWKTIEHTEVRLSDWNVAVTLPENLVGKAVCRYDSNGYQFSTKAIIEDTKCVEYYRTQEISSEGVGISQLPLTQPASGQIYGASGNLADYYKMNKAKDGDYFYAIYDNNTTTARINAARTAACKNESPNYAQPFVDAMPSIRKM